MPQGKLVVKTVMVPHKVVTVHTSATIVELSEIESHNFKHLENGTYDVEYIDIDGSIRIIS